MVNERCFAVVERLLLFGVCKTQKQTKVYYGQSINLLKEKREKIEQNTYCHKPFLYVLQIPSGTYSGTDERTRGCA